MRRIATVIVLAALALAPQALAAPAVGVEDAAYTRFSVVTREGAAFDVLLLASRPGQVATGPEGLLRVVVTPKGGASARFSAELPGSAVSFTSKAVTVRASLGGVPMTLSWRTTGVVGPTVVLGDAAAAIGRAGGWTAAGDDATTTIRLGGSTCQVGRSLIGQAVGHDTGAFGAPTAGAFGRASLKGARCTGS